mmetsp:Transcript_108912/g.303681  ORF Transcript_108912/g.303681 Transcript_108912/m.303681 type:complete len:377 (-) Transcript_108912:128-1258(-)
MHCSDLHNVGAACNALALALNGQVLALEGLRVLGCKQECADSDVAEEPVLEAGQLQLGVCDWLGALDRDGEALRAPFECDVSLAESAWERALLCLPLFFHCYRQGPRNTSVLGLNNQLLAHKLSSLQRGDDHRLAHLRLEVHDRVAWQYLQAAVRDGLMASDHEVEARLAPHEHDVLQGKLAGQSALVILLLVLLGGTPCPSDAHLRGLAVAEVPLAVLGARELDGLAGTGCALRASSVHELVLSSGVHRLHREGNWHLLASDCPLSDVLSSRAGGGPVLGHLLPALALARHPLPSERAVGVGALEGHDLVGGARAVATLDLVCCPLTPVLFDLKLHGHAREIKLGLHLVAPRLVVCTTRGTEAVAKVTDRADKDG